MIREAFITTGTSNEDGFRYRGEQPGRLENFSDAVFALAITLLMISTTAPANFLQVKRFVYELLPFFLSITLIILIWQQHFQFFLRYGLRTPRIVALNTFFLMIVLFYVYPLKFLTRLILIPLGTVLNKPWLVEEMERLIRPEELRDLMIIYGLGAAAVFFLLVLMYRVALKSSEPLQLSPLEIFDTKTSISMNWLMGSVPLFSTLIAWLLDSSLLAGFCYFLYTPLLTIHGRRSKRIREKLVKSLTPLPIESEAPGTTVN